MSDSHIFVRDIETRSVANLKKIGTHNYATHPTTEILCIGYCVDDERVKIWHPGEPIPEEYIEAARRESYAAVAHNAPFEMAIEREILGPRFGFPVIPIERNVCTMAVANALALPASLDKLAKVIKLKHQKDKVGNRLMQQMTKPRKPRKDEDPKGVYWFDDDERMLKLDSYCMDDVEASREVAYKLPWLSDDEYQVWLLDQKINNRGIYIDQELALAARKVIKANDLYLNHEIAIATNGEVTAISQVEKLKVWLSQHIDVAGLDKGEIEKLLSQKLPDHVKRVIELRRDGAQAAAKKVEALLARRNGTGRVYDAFVYHAAGPGRWSSRGAQLHNMKRSETDDVEKAVEIIGQGDFEIARKTYENPLSTIGDLIRAMVTAAPGHMLIGADFSGIEARVTAWLASEQSKLRIFRTFDAGQGPDPYLVAAALVLSLDLPDLIRRYNIKDPKTDKERKEKLDADRQRQVGKRCELAFGYQGGVNAFRKFSQWNRDHGLTRDALDFMALRKRKQTDDPVADQKAIDEEIEIVKNAWRKAHPNIRAMWRDLQNAMWTAARRPGQRVLYRDKLEFFHDGKTLWITLPSGRKLSYPEARIRRILDPKETGGLIIVSMKGKWALIFKDNASGRWRDVAVYGGLVTENCVQAIARDLLAQAMLRLDDIGLPVVAHVHDEAIVEVAKSKATKMLPEFHRQMTATPDWAKGLPIIAKAWSAARYVK